MLPLIPAIVCYADDRATDRSSLSGIKTVVVKVHTFESDWRSELAKAGLSEIVVNVFIEAYLSENPGK